MKFSDFELGSLQFDIVKADFIKKNILQPKFIFNENYYSSESFAIEYYKSKGFNAFFAENDVWTKLLIYLFYNELKRSIEHNPSLSNINHYLYDDDFFNENEDKFIKRFNHLKDVNLLTEMQNKCPNVDKKIMTICKHLDNHQILIVLFDLIQNLNIKKKGFPDLFVYNSNKSFFCEVKGNSDTLSFVQIKKHEVLLNAGIDVVVFGINKNKSWVNEQKKKYFNKSLFRRKNFIDNYDSKVYISNNVFNELKDYGIVEFKNNFIKQYGEDAFIGFMNIIKDYGIDEKRNAIKYPNDSLIQKSIKKGEKIKELDILKKGKILEDKKKYSEAIDEYSKVNSFDSYKRMIYCYRALRDYENELNLIYTGINEKNFDKNDVRFFKRRLKRFLKNDKDYSIIPTNLNCPYCGNDVVLNKFYTRNKIKFFTCSNDKCYWYGGIFKGDLSDIPNLIYSEEQNKIIVFVENKEQHVFCTQCGTKNFIEDNYCFKCGNKLRKN